jgi:hypothetical protein
MANNSEAGHAAYNRLVSFLTGRHGRKLFAAYRRAGAPYGLNGVGWYRWIREMATA